MTIKQDVLKLLPKLKPDELAEVQRAIKAIASLSGIAESLVGGQVISDGDYLIDGIAQYLITSGLLPFSNRAVYHLMHRDGYKTYRTKREDVEGFLLKVLSTVDGGRANRYQPQIAFLAASALADLLRNRNIFSVGAMLSQIDKIPEALDAAFPGYIEGGIFGFVLLNAGKDSK